MRTLKAMTRCRDMNHPRRTVEQSAKLEDMGVFPFPELTEAANDVIFQARLAGYAAFFPAYPNAHSQATSTLKGAQAWLADHDPRTDAQLDADRTPDGFTPPASIVDRV
jgi:hypothetical protein